MDAYRGIIFDRDGTLHDHRRTWAAWARRVLTELSGGDAQRARRLAAAVGFDIDHQRFEPDSVMLDGGAGEIAEKLLLCLPEASASSLGRHLAHASATLPPVEATPLVPLVSELRGRGISLAVASNEPAAEAKAHLKEAGVADAFRMVLGAGQGFAPKPAPEMLFAISDTAGLSPWECVMVGDSPSDLAAGRAAGMACLGVLTGSARRGQLVALADGVLPSIAALPAWLDRNAPGRRAA